VPAAIQFLTVCWLSLRIAAISATVRNSLVGRDHATPLQAKKPRPASLLIGFRT
jgi:hypothetical protein